MKKIVALFISCVIALSLCVPCFAEEASAMPDFELEIDVNKRYTDISEMDEYDEVYLDVEVEEEQAKESRKMVYITVLCVLLVVAIIILIVTLKRVPKEDDEIQTTLTDGEDSVKDAIVDEEKDDEPATEVSTDNEDNI